MADEDQFPQSEQSQKTKEWVARRDAADRAAEAVRHRMEADDALKREDAEKRVQESPILFLIGVIFAGIVIVGGLWWFITAVQCDPMISDRAFSSACK
jgi:hypothetical protein